MAQRTFNILTGDDTEFINSTGSWALYGYEDFEIERRLLFADQHHSLCFTPLIVTPTGFSRDGVGEVTVTVPSGHGLEVGDMIDVSGVVPATFDGSFEVTSSSATEITFSQDGDAETSTSHGMIGRQITAVLTSIPVSTGFKGDSLQFHSRIYSEKPFTAVIELSTDQGTSSSARTRVTESTWGVCRGGRLEIPDIGAAMTASISITLKEFGPASVHISLPFLYGTSQIFNSAFMFNLYQYLPNVIQQADLNLDNIPEALLARILEAGLYWADSALTSHYDFEYVDEDLASRLNYTPSESTLVEPAFLDIENAEWLAQFLGFKLQNPAVTATPWGAFSGFSWAAIQSDIDPNNDYSVTALSRSSNVVTATLGSHPIVTGDTIFLRNADSGFNGTFEVTSYTASTISWTQTGSDVTALVGGAVYLPDTEWEELEDFSPDFYDQSTYIRWQLNNAYAGINAGTLQAVKEAAKFNLSDTQIVTITTSYLSSPWNILVTTKTSETPNGVDNQSNETVLAEINKAKPAGFKLYHICTSTGS